MGGELGIINIFFAVGYAFGAVVFGMIVDATGGYLTAWIFMTVVAGLTYILLFIAAVHFLKKIEEKKIEALETSIH